MSQCRTLFTLYTLWYLICIWGKLYFNKLICICVCIYNICIWYIPTLSRLALVLNLLTGSNPDSNPKYIFQNIFGDGEFKFSSSNLNIKESLWRCLMVLNLNFPLQIWTSQNLSGSVEFKFPIKIFTLSR